MRTIRIRRPDDFHLHLRIGEMLKLVLPLTTDTFARALIMPNLKLEHRQQHTHRPPPPVMDVEDVFYYMQAIEQSGMPESFTRLMTISLTDETTPEMIEAAAAHIVAVKVYPKGATTNSGWGISDFDTDNFHACLDKLEELGLLLLLHPEVPSGFSMTREFRFLKILDNIIKRHPGLKIVVEHVTDRRTIEFVKAASDNVAATITAHHLLIWHDDVMGTRIRPDNFCLPTAKLEEDLEALQAVVLSGHPRFFFGSDSAPHDVTTKHCADGCAGCFTAPHALELVTEFLFRFDGGLERLEPFVSEFGADFYGLPRNTGEIELVNEPWTVPVAHANESHAVVPFAAGRTLAWQVRQP